MTKKTSATGTKGKTVLVLRTCDEKNQGYNGFQWPESGAVECPDWKPEAVCGNGLHGFLWGVGDAKLANWNETAKWLVVEVLEADLVAIGTDKVKYPRGTVIFCGDRKGATDLILSRAPVGTAVMGAICTSGDRGQATAGDRGQATAGYAGKATAGQFGIIQIRWWDAKANRYRVTTGYVGEDGIEPKKVYRLDEQGRLVPADAS